MNLLRDLADQLRNEMACAGHHVTNVRDDDHAALILYSKLQRYTIDPRPRRVMKAAGFDCPPCHSSGIRELELTIQRGGSLTPYRSKRITNQNEPDGLFDFWGIHHFHLGTRLESDGFIQRTNELLFCLIDKTSVYFIKVATHDSSPWVEKKLLEVVHSNWPDTIRPYRLEGVTGSSPEPSDSDRRELRRANVMSHHTMRDGTTYIETGLGNTTGGVHIGDLHWADHVYTIAQAVEALIDEDWPTIQQIAKEQGYNLGEATNLVLDECAPLVHWDILEPESGCRFRVNV